MEEIVTGNQLAKVNKVVKILSAITIASSLLFLVLFCLVIVFQNELRVMLKWGQPDMNIFVFPILSFCRYFLFVLVLIVFSVIQLAHTKLKKSNITFEIVCIVISVFFNAVFFDLLGSFDSIIISELSVNHTLNYSTIQLFYSYIRGFLNIGFLSFFSLNIILIVYKKMRGAVVYK